MQDATVTDLKFARIRVSSAQFPLTGAASAVTATPGVHATVLPVTCANAH